ncbi:hypothetical protein EJB05_11741, partial [Eragrostis curvula]
MPKLASSATQAELITYGQTKTGFAPRSDSSHPMCRRIRDPRACSTTQTAPSCCGCGTKRRAPSQARAPSRRAKRRRTEYDPEACHESLFHTWGAKRARSALPLLPAQTPRLESDSDTVPPGIWRDWTDLGAGPAGLIAERLLSDDVADYISFRATCRPWRLCCPTDPRAHGVLDRRFHPRHWIMLTETCPAPPYWRRFMNVNTGHCRDVRIPLLRGHDAFPTTEGLLVLLDRFTSVVRLLNPFTRTATNLPSAATLLTQQELDLSTPFIRLLKVTGAGLADESTVAVHFGNIETVAVAKPGDARWTVVERGTYICPAMSFAGRFYCATWYDIMVVETSADHHPPRLAKVAELASPLSAMKMDTVHLADIEGELMLVDRRLVINARKKIVDGHGSRTCTVYRVDLDARKIVPVRGLGGRAVFIGLELAVAVSPLVFPSISADAVYLGFDNLLPSWLDNSPIHLMDDDTSERREFGHSGYGPLGVDDHLSWFVAAYHDD